MNSHTDKKNDRIDLHCHTTASDGSLSPSALVKKAAGLGLAAIAVTDHDTIDGVGEGLSAGAKQGVEVVPGVELSTDFENKTVHVLGYFIDMENPVLTEKLTWAKGVRADRNQKIVERFNELGIPMTFEEVAKKAGGDVVGRPHFAAMLLEKKVVATIQEAFDIYLDRKGKAYVPKFRFTPQESFSLIDKTGGIAVLAHPGSYNWAPLYLDYAVEKMMELGLSGLEVLYSEHLPAQTQIFTDIAKRRGLLMTGGSDFHGDTKPEIDLGYGTGDLCVPYSFLQNLKDSRVHGK